METQPPPPIDPRSQLDTLSHAESAARAESFQRSEWWTPFIAALVGPLFVAVEVLDGTRRIVTVAGFLFVMVILAIWEARKVRVRRRFGPLPGRLGWIHFGFIFVLIVSLQLGEQLVGRMSSGVLVAVSYLVYLAFFLGWVAVFNRLAANCAADAAQP